MNVYRSFAVVLDRLLGPYERVRVTVDAHPPLSVERFRVCTTGRVHVALSLTHFRAGRRLCDPEIVFALHALPHLDGPLPIDRGPSRSNRSLAIPISFRNDITGRLARVHVRDQRGLPHFRRELQRDLTDYTAAWLRDLDTQGFLAPHTLRAVLG